MNIPGLSRIRRQASSFANRFRRRAVVLLYHRVGDAAGDPQLLSVSTARFAQHMEYLRRHYPVLSVERLAGLLAAGEDLPDQCVAVTFDDGYADNLLNAKPILERCRVPATVFVTAGHIDHNEEFWWDELEQIFLCPSTLPSRCHVQIGERIFDYNLAGATRYTDVDAERYRAWSVVSRENPTIRHQAYRDICAGLRGASLSERTAAMRALRMWSGIGGSVRLTHRCLSSEEVRELGAGQLVEVGAHSVSHPVLSSLPPPAQRFEIEQSKRDLEERLGHQVKSFAYPFGTKMDYSSETMNIVRDAGFTSACANFEDVTVRSTDRYQLPRIVVRDWSVEVFAHTLQHWIGRTGNMRNGSSARPSEGESSAIEKSGHR